MTADTSTMRNGDITMDDNGDPFAGWSEPTPGDIADNFLTDEDEETADFLEHEGSAPVDPSLLEPPARKPKAIQYEKKVKSPLRFATKMLLVNPSTIADGATLLQYAPDFSRAAGDLAAENANVAKVIDFMSDGTENATLAFVWATMPMVMQLLRNHEPVAEVQGGRQIKIPFTKKTWTVKMRVRLPWRIRHMTEDPDNFTVRVLTAPGVPEALAKQGITVMRANSK